MAAAPGSLLVWTEADLAALSTITPADVKAAAALWRALAPAWSVALWDAPPQEVL